MANSATSQGDDNAAGSGGGIYLAGNSLLKSMDSVFRTNRAQQDGGGIYNGGNAKLKLIKTNFLKMSQKSVEELFTSLMYCVKKRC